MRPGPFALFPQPAPSLVAVVILCGSCRFEGEHHRSVVPCSRCYGGAMHQPKPPPVPSTDFPIGCHVAGRDAGGRAFEGEVIEHHSPFSVVMSIRGEICLVATGLLDAITAYPPDAMMLAMLKSTRAI